MAGLRFQRGNGIRSRPIHLVWLAVLVALGLGGCGRVLLPPTADHRGRRHGYANGHAQTHGYTPGHLYPCAGYAVGHAHAHGHPTPIIYVIKKGTR